MILPLSCFVCGLARDCAGALCGSLASVERLGDCFQRIDLVIGTNDSVDETAEILTDWAASRPWATVFKVDGLASALSEEPTDWRCFAICALWSCVGEWELEAALI